MVNCSDKNQLRELLLDGVHPLDIDYHFVSDMSGLFKNWPNNRIPQLDTRRVWNMDGMFEGCKHIKTIPHLNTENVTTMDYMFRHCGSLNKIPALRTPRLKSARHMFFKCFNLTEIPRLDTSNLTDSASMFGHCYSLKTIPKINTSKVTNMYSMFAHCHNLETLPKLETSKCEIFNFMFEDCGKLEGPINWIKLDFENANNITENGEDFIRIFGIENTITFLEKERQFDEFSKEAIKNSPDEKSRNMLAKKVEKIILL